MSSIPSNFSGDLEDVSRTGAVGSNASLDMDMGGDPEYAESISTENMDNPQALLHCHPDYIENVTKWEKYVNTYEAHNIYSYIFHHSRESNDIFNKRVERGYYYNYVASVIDLFVSYLFHTPVNRDFGGLSSNPDLDNLLEDANLSGDKFEVFMQIIATFAQIQGHCGVLVDLPRTDDPVGSEAERKASGIRPYLTLINALQIKDWALDDHGAFIWVKLEIQPQDSRDWHSAYPEDLRSFVIWTKDEWQRWNLLDEKEAKLVAKGKNPFDKVPLIVVRNEKSVSHQWMGLSSVRDISDINIAILNWCSLGDEEIYERCLNVLVVERDGNDAPITLSHHNVLEYQPGTNAPQYLTPGTSPLEMISGWIERGRDEIYRLAKLGGKSGVLGIREATSGIAYAFEFNETNQSLSRKAQSLEQGETEIFRLIATLLGEEWDGNISYPREFGVDDFKFELEILVEARSTLTSETAIKELEKGIAAKLFSKKSQEVREKIAKEIESSPAKMTDMLNFQTVPAALTGSDVQDNREKDQPTGGNSEKGTKE